ncbi:hypothetical protein DL770_004859 [Monosporascus sp. CRB-9-2]|nr:hypothetical protein DL770_004859 [Monosporascus sp. CRB-9-2]
MEHVTVSQSETTALTPTCLEKDSPPELITTDADVHPVLVSAEAAGAAMDGKRGRGGLVRLSKYGSPGSAREHKVQRQQEHQHKRVVTYVVCSKTLSSSSPVFKRLLYGGFAESKKPEAGSQWAVYLPEDEPTPMKTILNIAHGRFDQVPIKWDTVKDLYLLTVLTDNASALGFKLEGIRLWHDILDPTHAVCADSFIREKNIEPTVEWKKPELTDFHKRHLAAQAKKSGLESSDAHMTRGSDDDTLGW